MKRISVIFLLLVMCITTMSAADDADRNRVVLTAAREFDEVFVSGDVTVELCYNTRHAGLIVYDNVSDDKERIRCYSDGSQLFVSGQCERHGVESRIVVFYDEPLKRIVHNGSGTVLATRIPDESSLEVILNGTGNIKLGKKLELAELKLVSNGDGVIRIPRIKANSVSIVANGSSDNALDINRIDGEEVAVVVTGAAKVAIKDIKAGEVAMVTSGSGNISAGGKAREVAVATTGSGSIDVNKMRCRTIVATVTGTGKIIYGGNPKDLKINGNEANTVKKQD